MVNVINQIGTAIPITPFRGSDQSTLATSTTAVGSKPVNDVQTSGTLQHGDLKGSFEYDKSLNQVIIILRSEQTGEIVQQFPPESILSMLTRMMESLGNNVDVKG